MEAGPLKRQENGKEDGFIMNNIVGKSVTRVDAVSYTHLKIISHDLAFLLQQLLYGMGPGAAAHKCLLVADKAFSGRKSQVCPGYLHAVCLNHVDVKQSAKGNRVL